MVTAGWHDGNEGWAGTMLLWGLITNQTEWVRVFISDYLSSGTSRAWLASDSGRSVCLYMYMYGMCVWCPDFRGVGNIWRGVLFIEVHVSSFQRILIKRTSLLTQG